MSQTINLAKEAPISDLVMITKRRANAAGWAGDFVLAQRLASEVNQVDQMGKFNWNSLTLMLAASLGSSVGLGNSIEKAALVATFISLLNITGQMAYSALIIEPQQREALRLSLSR